MTHQEILEKAIQRAMSNGWMPDSFYAVLELPTSYRVSVRANGRSEPKDIIGEHYFRVIYDHDFARALWGNGPDCALCGVSPHMQHHSNCIEGSNIWPFVWEWHLQQMVLADDPIAYLGEYMPA